MNFYIKGICCANKKNAKKSAAFRACIELYKVGALDDNLLPINIKNKPIFNDKNWFPHWEDNDVEALPYKLKPGTNKMKRMVHIEVIYSILFAIFYNVIKAKYIFRVHHIYMDHIHK